MLTSTLWVTVHRNHRAKWSTWTKRTWSRCDVGSDVTLNSSSMLKAAVLNLVSVYIELVCYFKYIDYISNIYTKLTSNLTIMLCRFLLLLSLILGIHIILIDYHLLTGILWGTLNRAHLSDILLYSFSPNWSGHDRWMSMYKGIFSNTIHCLYL